MDERYLSEIIEARVEQILRKSKEVLDEIDAFELPGGVVLTGGAASMPGIVDLAQEIFEANVNYTYQITWAYVTQSLLCH